MKKMPQRANETLRSDLQKILGAFPLFGSKSEYRQRYPKRNPIFNCYLLIRDSRGEFFSAWNGDVELTAVGLDQNLLMFANKHNVEVFLYRESTVNNEVFNGRDFPLNQYTFAITKHMINNKPFFLCKGEDQKIETFN